MFSQANRDLKGSESRDAFRYWHKQKTEFGNCYALDGDLFLVQKLPTPKILALLEYKRIEESVSTSLTFSEVIAYNDLTSKDIFVFILQSDALFSQFSLYRYVGGDYKPDPPTIQIETVFENGSAYDYWLWELGLRGIKSREVLDWLKQHFA